MCIYCGTLKYRKIYENHFGPIPKDENGRTYEIHHIDGNHKNNDPSNLKAITIQEHYNIHYAQGDYGACTRIGQRMNLPVEIISELSTRQNLQRVANGTHPFLGQKLTNLRKANGTHNLVGHNNNVYRRIADGSHNWLGPEHNLKRLAEGRDPSQRVHKCPHCGKVGKGGSMIAFHFDYCKLNPDRKIREAKKKICPHCGKIGTGSTIFRYHFDKCKYRCN